MEPPQFYNPANIAVYQPIANSVDQNSVHQQQPYQQPPYSYQSSVDYYQPPQNMQTQQQSSGGYEQYQPSGQLPPPAPIADVIRDPFSQQPVSQPAQNQPANANQTTSTEPMNQYQSYYYDQQPQYDYASFQQSYQPSSQTEAHINDHMSAMTIQDGPAARTHPTPVSIYHSTDSPFEPPTPDIQGAPTSSYQPQMNTNGSAVMHNGPVATSMSGWNGQAQNSGGYPPPGHQEVFAAANYTPDQQKFEPRNQQFDFQPAEAPVPQEIHRQPILDIEDHPDNTSELNISIRHEAHQQKLRQQAKQHLLNESDHLVSNQSPPTTLVPPSEQKMQASFLLVSSQQDDSHLHSTAANTPNTPERQPNKQRAANLTVGQMTNDRSSVSPREKPMFYIPKEKPSPVKQQSEPQSTPSRPTKPPEYVDQNRSAYEASLAKYQDMYSRYPVRSHNAQPQFARYPGYTPEQQQGIPRSISAASQEQFQQSQYDPAYVAEAWSRYYAKMGYMQERYGYSNSKQAWDQYMRYWQHYNSQNHSYAGSEHGASSRGGTPGIYPGYAADGRPGSATMEYYGGGYGYDAPYWAQQRQQKPKTPSPPARRTPSKHPICHVKAGFAPNGLFAKLLPTNPKSGDPAIVQICQIDDLLIETDLATFPGPLVVGETNKVDILDFCRQKKRQCLEDLSLFDRSSKALLWSLLQLLIKQNGTVIGSDVAEILLDDVDIDQHNMEQVVPELNVDVTGRFRSLLLYGRKRDALEWAMSNGLWGHALFLSSKMDTRTYASVMTRFANTAITANDPLQTLYQLMSFQQPHATTQLEDVHSWRVHLAMMLANPADVGLDARSIGSLGDLLASKGFFHASQFCHLMSGMPFAAQNDPGAKLVLVGWNHKSSEPWSLEDIEFSEVYEYARSLANQRYILPTLLPFKFRHLMKLAEQGHVQKARHYCEVISSVLDQFGFDLVSPTFICGLFDFANQLRMRDSTQTDSEALQKLSGVVQLIIQGHPIGDNTREEPVAIQPEPSNEPPSSQVITDDIASEPQLSSPRRENLVVETPLMNEIIEERNHLTNQHPPETGIQIGDSDSNVRQTYEQQQPRVPDEPPQPANFSSVGASASLQPPPSMFILGADGSSENLADPEVVREEPTEPDIIHGAPDDNVDNAFDESTRSLGFDYGHDQPYVPTGRRESSPRDSRFKPYDRSRHRTISSSTSERERNRSSSGDAASGSSPPGSPPAVAKTIEKNSSLGAFTQIFRRIIHRGKNQMNLPDDSSPSIVYDDKLKRWVSSDGTSEDVKPPPPPPKDLNLPSSFRQPRPPLATRPSYVDVMNTKSGKTQSTPPPTGFIPQPTLTVAPQVMLPGVTPPTTVPTEPTQHAPPPPPLPQPAEPAPLSDQLADPDQMTGVETPMEAPPPVQPLLFDVNQYKPADVPSQKHRLYPRRA